MFTGARRCFCLRIFAFKRNTHTAKVCMNFSAFFILRSVIHNRYFKYNHYFLTRYMRKIIMYCYRVHIIIHGVHCVACVGGDNETFYCTEAFWVLGSLLCCGDDGIFMRLMHI